MADSTLTTAAAPGRCDAFEAALQEWHAATADIHRLNQRPGDLDADDAETAAAFDRQVAAAKRVLTEPAHVPEYLTAKLRVYAQMWAADGDATDGAGRHFDVVALAAMEADVSRLFWRLWGRS